MRSGRAWRPGHLMLAQLSPYRHCAVLLLKQEGRSHSTMSWTHFAPWTPMQRRPATVTAASFASAGFSAAAAARANLSTNGGTVMWLSLFTIALMISACLCVAAVAINAEG